mgnify:CR=1 FL=1
MKQTVFEQMNGTYTQQGDYPIPRLTLHDEEKVEIALWGQRHLRYLKQSHKVLYYNLLTSGKLNSHIAEIDKQANDMFFRLVKELAEKESCIIVGRCANYILRDNPDVLSVFVHADDDFCLARAMERNSFSEKETKKFIERTDKYRSDFYHYHTGHHWTDARYYDLCLDSSKLGFEKCVEEIEAYAKIRFRK